MDAFFRRWIGEARAMGLPWWQATLLILIAALMKVLVSSAGVAAWDLIRRIHMDVEPDFPFVTDGGTLDDEARRGATPAYQDPKSKPGWTDAG